MPKKFTKNDPRINRKGRPKKEFSLTQGLRDFMCTKDLESKKQIKELLIKKTVDMALDGDITAIKLIFNYIDGPPPIQSLYDKEKEEEYFDEEVDESLDEILEGFAEEEEKEIERRVQKRLEAMNKSV